MSPDVIGNVCLPCSPEFPITARDYYRVNASRSRDAIALSGVSEVRLIRRVVFIHETPCGLHFGTLDPARIWICNGVIPLP